jgi:hypothetical protein
MLTTLTPDLKCLLISKVKATVNRRFNTYIVISAVAPQTGRAVAALVGQTDTETDRRVTFL